MAGPFLKWAGGKRQLVDTISKYCPVRIDTYFEPFLGGGTLFFHLINSRPKFHAILSDSNAELINVYKCVRDDVMEVIELLKIYQAQYYQNPKNYFYKVRDQERPRGRFEKAARFIFLNRTCYNGLYRVNKAGRFNVPHGSYLKPEIVNEDKLIGASRVLQDSEAEIVHSPYHKVLKECGKGDLVYLDPPYLPLSRTSHFTDYTKEKFGLEEQFQLSRHFRRLSEAGCTTILSNSNTREIKVIYKGFRIIRVESTRQINCKADNRSGHCELLIVNKSYRH